MKIIVGDKNVSIKVGTNFEMFLVFLLMLTSHCNFLFLKTNFTDSPRVDTGGTWNIALTPKPVTTQLEFLSEIYLEM